MQVNAPGSDGLHLNTPSNAGSRLNQTPLETPASVQILNGDTIRDRDQFAQRQHPPNVPARSANVFLTWNFAENWQARADAQYVGKRSSTSRCRRLTEIYAA